MLVVIREGETLSPKTVLAIQLLKSNINEEIIYVTKNTKTFAENWDSKRNTIELGTSFSAICTYYLLMFLKSPHDLRDGIIRRLFNKKKQHVIVSEGFLSILSETLYYHFATKSRFNRLTKLLNEIESPKVFLIDEFVSIRTVNLQQFQRLGSIVYVTQDLACNRYGFADNRITKNLMYMLEKSAVNLADLIISCSERDRLQFIKMGARQVVYYPNIYPTEEPSESKKDQTPSICLVLKGHWGKRAEKSLNEVFEALSFINSKIKVYLVGIKQLKVPKNIELHYYSSIPNKKDFLNLLAKSVIGINIGIHEGGTNERKYEYALAGLVVFSDYLGIRGDLLPHEYSYLDSFDLGAKLTQILNFDMDDLLKMGLENQKQALALAKKQREILSEALATFFEN